jgi:hypothetical protein
LGAESAERAENAETVCNAETAEPAESFSTLSAHFVGTALNPSCASLCLSLVAGLPLTCAEGAENAETVCNAETAEPAESFSTLSAHFVGSALINKSSAFFAGSALNPSSAPR